MYLPTHAHRKSVLRRFRPKKRKIDANPRLRTVVWAMVKDRYSPEQISGRLRSCYPGDETMYVCPETIYQSLYFQAKGELKRKSLLHCVAVTPNVDLVARAVPASGLLTLW